MIQVAARLDERQQHAGWKVEMGVRRERSKVDVLFVCLFLFSEKEFFIFVNMRKCFFLF
jgi:hypothetical protein